jgi:hypothetical protein
MKNLFLAIILIVIPSNIFAQQKERIGFAGIVVPLSTDKSTGLGIEVSTLKDAFGIGFQVSYIPETIFTKSTTTSSNVFLLWKVTDEFIIRTGAGAIQTETLDMRLNYPSVIIGPMFPLGRIYIGIQANLIVESGGKGLSPSSVSFALGLKFD